MNHYILNPYLPEYEYIPDGEPHVFGDRVYVFGSHDRFDGKKFCMNDYVSYSADVKDLTSWRYEGVIYTRTQDPRMKDGTHQLWAPDVVQGADGRYYLYYCPDDSILAIGVAVSDTPAGKYEFYGVVRDKQGYPIGERPGDTYCFDPGVFRDDDGTYYLYSGNGPRTRAQIGKEPKASKVMKLMDDMLTIAEEPKKMLPTLGEAEGTGFEGHEFFEASSIRKIRGKYYLVYSSVNLHELCYAISDRPDGGWQYGGAVVSNSGYLDTDEEKTFKNSYGNDHGGIECINGEYYIFYHRPTHRSNFSRQGLAEHLTILPDGKIVQAEQTSMGLNPTLLPDVGTFPASSACILHGKQPQTIAHPLAMGKRHPYLMQDGPDFDRTTLIQGKEIGEEDAPFSYLEAKYAENVPPRMYITNAKKGFVAGFRYFDIEREEVTVYVKVRGKAKGTLYVGTTETIEEGVPIAILPSPGWSSFGAKLHLPKGKCPLYFKYDGKGTFEFLEFTLL